MQVEQEGLTKEQRDLVKAAVLSASRRTYKEYRSLPQASRATAGLQFARAAVALDACEDEGGVLHGNKVGS